MYDRHDTGLGCLLGIAKTLFRAFSMPFRCTPGDRPLVIFLLVLSIGALGATIAYVVVGTYTRTQNLVYFPIGVAGAVMFLIVSFWGADATEIEETFEDPLDPDYDAYSGRPGSPF
jgi:hypothetical protein